MTFQIPMSDPACFQKDYHRFEFQSLTALALERHTFGCVAEYIGVKKGTLIDWLKGRGLCPPYAQQTSADLVEFWLRALREIADITDCVCRDDEQIRDWLSDFDIPKNGIPVL